MENQPQTRSEGQKSAVDWDAILCDPAVREVTTKTLLNRAYRHDAQTDERLLKNLDSCADQLNHILDLSMADVNGKK